VLLTFLDLGPKPGPAPHLLKSLFGLTAAEAKLASLVAGGVALGEIARQLDIAHETARTQLKSVFAKNRNPSPGRTCCAAFPIVRYIGRAALQRTVKRRGRGL
jgi:DNA-binding CsgD family transcriptional regulator